MRERSAIQKGATTLGKRMKAQLEVTLDIRDLLVVLNVSHEMVPVTPERLQKLDDALKAWRDLSN